MKTANGGFKIDESKDKIRIPAGVKIQKPSEMKRNSKERSR